MKRKIGSEFSECTSCRLCEGKCPTDVELERILRLHRYISGVKGSHGSMFLTMGRLASRPSWHFDEGETDPDSGIVYFPGCTPLYDTAFKTVDGQPYGDYSAMGRDRKYSNMGLCGLKVMNKMGVVPRMETGCCGHDQYYAGRLDSFEEMKGALKNRLEGAEVIISPCAECRYMLAEVYGLPAVHISEYIWEHRDQLDLEDTGLSVMYHDSCRLGRCSGVYDPPRELISSVATLREFDHSKEDAKCCGVSGWLNCNQMSKRQREEKLDEFLESGADFLLVGCPKCAMHLDCLYYEEGEGKRRREAVNIIDISELIALSLGIYSMEDVGDVNFSSSGGANRLPEPLTGDRDPTRYIDQALKEDLFNCSTCMQCTAICPSEFDSPHLMEGVRSYLVSVGENPEKHQRINEAVESVGNPYGETEEIYDEGRGDHIYFPGCTTKYRTPGLYEGSKKVMEAMGIDHCVPRDMVCCGSPLLRIGYDPEDIKKKNRDVLDRKVITSCAGCHATFFHDYEDIDVEHLVELLARRIDELPLNSLNMKVVYHDPCHLGREFSIYEEPRRVIKSIPGVELLEFGQNRENSQCCGGGGGLRSWNSEKSRELAESKMTEAVALGVDAVLSACPFCKLNLQDAGEIPVLDIVELVRMSLEDSPLSPQ